MFGRAGFMGGEVRLCLEKQAGMLYKVCLVSPCTSHLVKEDGNYSKLWKCESRDCLCLSLLLFSALCPLEYDPGFLTSLSFPQPFRLFSLHR